MMTFRSMLVLDEPAKPARRRTVAKKGRFGIPKQAKKAIAKKASRRKTFREQGVEAWDRYTRGLSRTESITKDHYERDAFLLGFEKGVKAHQSQRDHDGRPSEKECKQAALLLKQARTELIHQLVGGDEYTQEQAQEHPQVARTARAIAALGGRP